MDKITNRTIKICSCGKKFSVVPCRLRIKYCSRDCYYKYGLDTRGDKNGRWKGDNIGKLGCHDWIEKEKGKAKYLYCENKNNECMGRLEWSNKSHKYLRRVDDWQILCSKHHKIYDYKIFGKRTKRNN